MTGAWYCLNCDATGQGDTFDRDAEKHTKTTGHGTTTSLSGLVASRRKKP